MNNKSWYNPYQPQPDKPHYMWHFGYTRICLVFCDIIYFYCLKGRYCKHTKRPQFLPRYVNKSSAKCHLRDRCVRHSGLIIVWNQPGQNLLQQNSGTCSGACQPLYHNFSYQQRRLWPLFISLSFIPDPVVIFWPTKINAIGIIWNREYVLLFHALNNGRWFILKWWLSLFNSDVLWI